MKKGTIKMNQKIDEALGALVSVVTPDHAEWEERRARWNHFSNDTETRIIAVPKSMEDVVIIVNWVRENGQKDIGVRAGLSREIRKALEGNRISQVSHPQCRSKLRQVKL